MNWWQAYPLRDVRRDAVLVHGVLEGDFGIAMKLFVGILSFYPLSRRDIMLVEKCDPHQDAFCQDAVSISMPNTYTQIHIQTVFTVRNRTCVIRSRWKEELYRYITGIVQAHGHKVLAINGMPDHVHLFFGMRPKQSLSNLMQAVKGDSSKWINTKKLVRGKFSWQKGYGVFSYSKSQVPKVIQYVRNQEEHHPTRTFIEEYHDLLQKFGVSFDERYSFSPVAYENDDGG